MRDYVREARDIARDIYLDKIRHFLIFLSSYSSFEELLEDMKRNNNALIVTKKEVKTVKNLEDYMILEKNTYKFYKLILENKFNFENGSLLTNPNEGTLRTIFLKILKLNKLYRENYIYGDENDPVILYPIYSLDFSIYDYINLNVLNSSKNALNLNVFLEYLKKSKFFYGFNKKVLSDLKNMFKTFLDGNKKEPFDEQYEVIQAILENLITKIEGVPGASKTFTGAFALLITSLHDILAEKIDNFNWLVTGITYRSIEESFKQFYEALTSKVFLKFLKEKDITVHLIFLHSKDRNYSTFKESYPSIGNIKVTFNSNNYISKKGKIKIVFAPASRFISYPFFKPSEEEKAEEILESLLESDIDYALKKFSELYIDMPDKNRTIDTKFNGIHIEEASQFSPIKLLLVLNSFIYQILPNIRNIDSGSIESIIKQNRFRISFSGDHKQLSPIYQYIDFGINLLKIGDFYNMFTFFYSDNVKTTHLATSLRVPEKILRFSKILYDKLEHYREHREKDILPEASDFFEEKLKVIAKYSHIGRIKYKIIGPDFIKNLPTKSNEIESILSKKIYEAFKNNLEKNKEKAFFLSPYRAQEYLNASKDIKEVGTVDKTQGNAGWLIVYSTVSVDPLYLEDNLGFLTVPNRINVAITRTKGLFLLLHSQEFEDIIWGGMPDIDKLAIEDFIFSFSKRTNKQLSKVKALKLLPEFDLHKGIYMLQKFLYEVSQSIGKLYLPLKFKDGIINPPEEIVFLEHKPEANCYVELEFFTDAF